MDSLLRIEKGAPAELAGGQSEDNNGNGSLMRILPASLRFATDPFESFVEKLERASAITHAHARSKMGCVFYGLLVRELLGGQPASEALKLARTEFVRCYERAPELPAFRHLLENSLDSLPEDEVLSTGYVLHTLHASLWCLLTTRNFRDAVLKAVNLGGDTDTTGCVTGGLAGVTYGLPALPGDWINQLARKDDVDCLFREFADLCETPGAK
jgi:ADP-ribosylglycohydrolase